jgi:hypothetical protein
MGVPILDVFPYLEVLVLNLMKSYLSIIGIYTSKSGIWYVEFR